MPQIPPRFQCLIDRQVERYEQKRTYVRQAIRMLIVTMFLGLALYVLSQFTN